MRRSHGMSLEEAVVDAGAVRFRLMLLTAAAVVVGASVILFDAIFQGLAECAADVVREFERASPMIFPGRSYRWLMKAQPLMPRGLLATQLAQAARKMRTKRSA